MFIKKQRSWGTYRISVNDEIYDIQGKFIFYEEGFYEKFRKKSPKTVDKAVILELSLK